MRFKAMKARMAKPLISNTLTFKELSPGQQWTIMRHPCRPFDMFFSELQRTLTMIRYCVTCRVCGERLVGFNLYTEKRHLFQEAGHG